MSQAVEVITKPQLPRAKVAQRTPLEGELIDYDSLVEIKRARYYRLYDQIRGRRTTLQTR